MTTSAVHPVDLEPSLIGTRTYTTRRFRTRLDVTAILCLTLVLLYALPGQLIVPELTYAGRPALLLALGLFFMWVMARLNPRLVLVGPQPIRWFLGAYLVANLLSYIAGLMRGLPSVESNAQDFAMLQVAEFLGVALVAADGIQNWDRLNKVLRVLVYSGGFLAIVGICQAVLNFNLAQLLILPGLQMKDELEGPSLRGDGQFRIAGTALHYIEFSAVLAITVPFAIHVARFAARKLHRRVAALCAVLAALANPLSISRTGIVALALAMLVMIPVWPWRLRYNFLIMAAGVGVALMFVKPGVLGTLKAMFLHVGVDPSIEGRTNDYAMVGYFFSQRPWLGRGPRTLIADPVKDTILDNQWLYTLVTGGLIGVAVLAALHIAAISLAVIAMRRAKREEDRHLCAVIIATQVIAIVVAGTFDSLYYTTYAITVALSIGLAGTLWRFTHPKATIRTSTVRRPE